MESGFFCIYALAFFLSENSLVRYAALVRFLIPQQRACKYRSPPVQTATTLCCLLRQWRFQTLSYGGEAVFFNALPVLAYGRRAGNLN